MKVNLRFVEFKFYLIFYVLSTKSLKTGQYFFRTFNGNPELLTIRHKTFIHDNEPKNPSGRYSQSGV